MPGPAIKICGITEPEGLEAAIAARAQYVGFNFHPPSPRHLGTERAAELGARAAGRIGVVGLFVDADPVLIARALDAIKFDALQFHGGESPAQLAQIRAKYGIPVWKAISIASRDDLGVAERYASAADLVLLDAKTPKGALTGGLGLAFDWTLIEGWRAPLPWGLAGGLHPANVSEAVAMTNAALVDTSSGVETAPGVKDPALIAAFCRAAQNP